MSGKRMWLMGAVVALLGGTGCCRWCDHWCHQPQPVPAYTAAPYAAPCCTPCAPVAPPCCPPGTVANTNPQWQRNPACGP